MDEFIRNTYIAMLDPHNLMFRGMFHWSPLRNCEEFVETICVLNKIKKLDNYVDRTLCKR